MLESASDTMFLGIDISKIALERAQRILDALGETITATVGEPSVLR